MYKNANPELSGNKLLAALPLEDYQRLVPYLESVTLELRQILFEPSEPIAYVYFPQESMISLVALMEEGSTVEVGLVGNEGMIGIPTFLGGDTTTTQAIVQVAGRALRMDADLLKREFKHGGKLQDILLRYTQALLTQVGQIAVCNRLHTIEERLARWLLTVQDGVQRDEFLLTQEFIAEMLGTRRSGVTVAAGALQQAGMIRYSRGRINICDRKSLEAASCKCYEIIQTEWSRLLD